MTGRRWGGAGALLLAVAGCWLPAGSSAPPPLMHADGRPRPAWAAAVPADPQARTRAGRYATGVQALALEQALGAGVVHVTVDRGVPRAVGAVRQALARRGLPASAPIVVAGPDLPAAAQVADQLAAAGHTRVWLVTR